MNVTWAERREVVNYSDRRMWLAGLSVGGADERDANALLTQVHHHAAMEDLIVWVREDDEQRGAA